jgi:diguanylate cyclase (GGDEF)-like protein
LLVEIIEDVTQRREAQRQLLHLARHDALTGLPNRTALFEGLTEAMTAAGRQAQRVSVVLLDLDQFKKVNDTLGHAIGDTLLREFAVRLAGCVRPGDTVGRLGGDEFAVIVPTAAGTQGGIEVANRIMEALKAPFAIESAVIPMTASLGISNSPEDGTDFETLLRHADAAMYEAKASGRDAVRTYDACMGAHARRQPSPTPSNVHRRNGANGMPWRAANA